MKMSDERVVWMNGALVPWAQATVPILSHGFSRGSAIFDTFGVHVDPEGEAVAFRMDAHLARLLRSAELLGMELKYTAPELAAAVAELVRVEQPGRGLIKIIAYWGEEAVVSMVPTAKLDVAIFAVPRGDGLHLDEPAPISVCVTSWRKLHPETVAVEAKACGNYLNGYLVRKEAIDRGFDVGIMLGTDGLLAEGSTESVFLVNDGVLQTPREGRVLQSISRMSILEMAPTIGIETRQTDLTAADLAAADEIFTSHSGVKVHPVDRCDERRLAAPGPVTARLIELVDDVLQFRAPAFAHYFQSLA